jgi:predicted transcriptional regulator
MITAKAKIKEVVEALPEDASYEEIMRELTFRRMVDRGLEDSREGRIISNEDMQHRIRTWQK